MSLKSYHGRRDFKKTTEPKGHVHHTKSKVFCVQKHAASHLHYDFRLELGGVLLSWAVPKGPCYDPDVKRLAIHVEDHPLEYATFEGVIPKGQYGGGTVMLWDYGTWQPIDTNPAKAYKEGHLRLELNGDKLSGRWDLIRFKQNNEWFLIKYKDQFAKPLADYDVTIQQQFSVLNHDDHFPTTAAVELATLVDKPPIGKDWLHEVKFDGYRIIAFKHNNEVTLLSRNNKDWTNKFQSIADEIKQIPVKNAIFDGELCLLNEKGRSDFQALQNSIKLGKSNYIYYIFDLLFLEKQDLRDLELLERKNRLSPLLTDETPSLRYSDHIIDHGNDAFKQACKLEMEGIVSKRVDSLYVGKRTKSWLKVKCAKRQEFVIGGFSKPQGSREYFGSLYLGVFDQEGKFIFCGNVGTGFTERSLKALYQELKKLITEKSPFTTKPPNAKAATWVKPKLVIEVQFSEWTQDGRLRHPSFKGSREDKPSKDVTKETKKPIFALTNAEKILYPDDKITKQQLYNYYDEISQYILPFIRNRPLSLFRCPSSYTDCFYQKHFNHSTAKRLHEVPIKGKKGVEQYIYLDDKSGLLSLVQMNVLEIHPWGSKIKNLEYPDMIIFDLDPAPDVEWKHVVAAAFDIKHQLEQYKLVSFVKTTGGKGLHVVIPIQPEYDWEAVKNFTHVFVNYMEKREPKKYISKMSKNKRVGKIFVDYLRNQRGATAVAVYSSRARLHAPVSTPVHWDELTSKIDDTFYTIKTIPTRLQSLKNDPWVDFWDLRQSLNPM